MRLLINTATTYKGGGVQVAKSFIEECRNLNQNEYHIILGEKLSMSIDQKKFPDNFSFYSIGYRPATRVISFQSHNRAFKDLEKRIQPDVVFTTSGPAYWRPKAPHLTGYNLPHYIYRDSPFFSQIPFTQKMKWAAKGVIIKYYFKRDSDAYVVQTDDINKRLKKWLKTDSVYTVTNTCSQDYRNPIQVNPKLPERKNGEFRLLTLSAWYTHKNLQIIPEVIECLPEIHRNMIRFVLTLPDEEYKNHFSSEYREWITNLGPVKPEEGPSLYDECDALFLPTLLECFSASYAEAMARRKPILTSDLGFAKAVCGESALYFNPVKAKDIAEKIVFLIKCPVLQNDLVEKGLKQLNTFHNAEERAEAYLQLCKELINE